MSTFLWLTFVIIFLFHLFFLCRFFISYFLYMPSFPLSITLTVKYIFYTPPLSLSLSLSLYLSIYISIYLSLWLCLYFTMCCFLFRTVVYLITLVMTGQLFWCVFCCCVCYCYCTVTAEFSTSAGRPQARASANEPEFRTRTRRENAQQSRQQTTPAFRECHKLLLKIPQSQRTYRQSLYNKPNVNKIQNNSYL